MIFIKECKNADTRTADKDVSYFEFDEATKMHQRDVAMGLAFFGSQLKLAGLEHDRSKIANEEKFWKDFRDAIDNGTNFCDSDAYKQHVNAERHHLLSRCPEDVDLIDVMEMIADCTCAGMARTGEIFPIELSNEVLQKAFQNTIELLKRNIKVIPIDRESGKWKNPTDN